MLSGPGASGTISSIAGKPVLFARNLGIFGSRRPQFLAVRAGQQKRPAAMAEHAACPGVPRECRVTLFSMRHASLPLRQQVFPLQLCPGGEGAEKTIPIAQPHRSQPMGAFVSPDTGATVCAFQVLHFARGRASMMLNSCR